MSRRRQPVLSYVLASCLATASVLAVAGTKSASMECGGSRITIVSECRVMKHSRLPICERQTLTVRDGKTGKERSFDSTARLKDGTVDGVTDQWACVAGTDRDYILLWSNNGGNCPECEWLDIVDLDGSLLARGRTASGRSNESEYQRMYKKLGLPEEFPERAFTPIPLY